ncbi:hypothetical protein [Nafulsella turpanensis]|uniref:hypothetical protein n=1 Tax=Nafulsella turpanensis TaxID=1265690 RepID=UPI00034DC129|nr:hypothetical protein [Nafulsella turpanensis]
MKLKHKILGGIAGTTGMSAFSYAWSRVAHQQFREPVLLALLLEGKRNKKAKVDSNTKIIGWMLHYMVGAVFSLGYTKKVLKGKQKEGLGKGVLMGAMDGLLGVGIWKMVFSLHPKPPEIAQCRYFLHLFLAHLVFGLCTSKALLYLEGEGINLIESSQEAKKKIDLSKEKRTALSENS